MSATSFRTSGIEPVGSLPWGSHFCEFYRTKQDLIDTLVPFFAAGLRDNELCIWVTTDALERDEAEQLLADAVPDYRDRVNRGQIELHDHRDWYVRAGSRLPGVLEQWLNKEAEALERGFDGLRLTGDTAFVHRQQWDGFVEYERTVNETFGGFRLIGLCTYNVDRCTAGDVLDIMSNHQFALARWRGEWELLEQARVKVTKDELERRVHERTQELEQALRSRDEFLAMLGHELRNPLAPIRNAAELLRALGNGEPNILKVSEIVERQTMHMGRLLDDLLDVARITHGRISLDWQLLDLRDVVAQAVEAASSSAEAYGHTLSLERNSSYFPVRGDSTRLAQVLGNLLDNAIKYTPNGGRISVSMRQEEGEAAVSVTDTGVGLPRELLPTVFELFTQGARPVDRADGGLGLGLAVVRNLIEMHGGRVEAHSAGRSRGCTFTFRLPLTPADEQALVGQVSASDGLHPMRILIIDDNLDAAESIALVLAAKGHDVRVSGDGVSALDMVREHRPDGVVLDIGLPGMDGYEVARRLRGMPELSGTRLIALTGYGQSENRARAERAGFDDYLVKPVTVETLEQALVGR